jgi:hypothetical protein
MAGSHEVRGSIPLGSIPSIPGETQTTKVSGTNLSTLGAGFSSVGVHPLFQGKPEQPKCLVVIPGAGHVSNLEAPEQFNAGVRSFYHSLISS